MRAPYQILALPYRYVNEQLQFCIMLRADHDQWQFISGGGEDDEKPIEAARREIFEESGLRVTELMELKSMCYIPTFIYPEAYLCGWSADTYVVPEYAFGFHCEGEITLSDEHVDFGWFSYEDARSVLKWDSNKTALYELYRRLGGE